MSGLTLTEAVHDDAWTSILVEGEIDLATVDELTVAVEKVLADGSKNLVVDLRSAGFMDSTGLKSLVVANREFGAEGRSFALAVKPGPIWRLIDLSGVASTMTIVEDLDELADITSDVS
jgi:anti-sigma B factor antagonist